MRRKRKQKIIGRMLWMHNQFFLFIQRRWWKIHSLPIPFKAPRAYTLSLREERKVYRSLCVDYSITSFLNFNSLRMPSPLIALILLTVTLVIIDTVIQLFYKESFSLQRRSQVFVFKRGKLLWLCRVKRFSSDGKANLLSSRISWL